MDNSTRLIIVILGIGAIFWALDLILRASM
jgi:hypothetical protein